MGDYNKDDYTRKGRKPGRGKPSRGGSNRDNSSRGGRFGRSDSIRSPRSERPTMHKVVCDGCNVECEVPFKPTSSKPVYCSECFKKKGGKSNQSSEELGKINIKLDKILKALKIDE